jgi:hypothetical protein
MPEIKNLKGKNKDYIWCDRYDGWRAVQACMHNCWRFNYKTPAGAKSTEACTSFDNLTDDDYQECIDKYTERRSK